MKRTRIWTARRSGQSKTATSNPIGTRNTFKGASANPLDLRFAVHPHRGPWEAALYANNLNDDRSITQVTALGSYPNAAISPPRQYGVEFSYRW